MAKDPSRVEVKTRLAPTLNAGERNQIYQALLDDSLDSLSSIENGSIYLACHPDKQSSQFKTLETKYQLNLMDQVAGDLGKKMESCFVSLLERYSSVIIFGTDLPYLPTKQINSAISNQSNWDVLIGESYDGGYYCIGLSTEQFKPIFKDVKWSTESVLSKTISNCKNLNLKIDYLPKVRDIDTIDDLVIIQEEIEKSDSYLNSNLKDALKKIDLQTKQLKNAQS